MKEKDAFDQWWQWAEKPVDSVLMIPTELHDSDGAVTGRPARPGQGQ